MSFGFELVRSELSRRSADRGVASVGRSSGGASGADRDNEGAGWPATEAEIQVPQLNKNTDTKCLCFVCVK
ncbi:MAG: hypothetical protein Q8N88_04580 [Nanoarchaeota archaeon]|nr:hypothetical protein [Nanoarchaeota archaeon]